jgi:TonB family protein
MLHKFARLSGLLAAVAASCLTITTIASAKDVADTSLGSPKALCAIQHADASTSDAFPVDFPEIARQMDASGTVYLQIDLTSSGSIANVSVAKSSGNRYLDDAALRAARASTFSPEINDCTAVGGSFLYVVDFH